MDLWYLLAQHPCSVCRSFKPARHFRLLGDSTQPFVYSRRYKPRNLQDFVQSSAEDCPGCTLMINALNAWNREWVEENGKRARIEIAFDKSMMVVRVQSKETERSRDFMIFQSQGPNTFERLTKPWYSTYDIVRDTNMPEAFGRGTSWLQNCLEKHACGSGTHIDWLPTRLIDLKSRSPGSIDVVYLVERPSERSPYAALSYCWGQDLQGVTRTLLANKETHVDGIPVGTIPKTIQDAIRVCHGLRIRYLWVDSLCIVQDDLDDWEREAAMMSSVYRFAQVTICAHAAASCKDGFLGPQVYGQSAWQRAFYTTSQRTPGFKFCLRDGQRYSTQRGTVPSVLDTRGWALQEAILSPRLLHYTGNDMVWECGGAHFCECGHVEGFSGDDTRPMTKTEFARAGRDMEKGDETIRQWKSIITQYSRRFLTKDSDKLVAIRGLAKVVWGEDFEKGSGQYPIPTYISGMFNKGFLEQLLWHTKTSPDMNETDFEYLNLEVSVSSAEGNYPKPRRMCPSVAPSWSWASIDGQITFDLGLDGTDLRSYVKIIGSNEFLGISGLTGEIRARDLILEGLLVPVAMKTLQRMDMCEDDTHSMWPEDTTFVRHADGRAYPFVPDADMDVQIFMADSAHKCWSSAEFATEGASSLPAGASPLKSRLPLPKSEGSIDYGSWGKTASRSSGGYLMSSSCSSWSSEEHTDESNDANDQICRSGADSSSSSQEREDQAAMERSHGTGIDSADADARSDEGEEQSEVTWDGINYGMPSSSLQSDGSARESDWFTSDDLESSELGYCAWCEDCIGNNRVDSESPYRCLRMAKCVLGNRWDCLVYLVLRRFEIIPDAWERVGLGLLGVHSQQDTSDSLFSGGIVEVIRLV